MIAREVSAHPAARVRDALHDRLVGRVPFNVLDAIARDRAAARGVAVETGIAIR